MLPPNDIHAVEIPRGKTLAIHVYGLDLARQWRYQFDKETGEVKPFAAPAGVRSRTENASVSRASAGESSCPVALAWIEGTSSDSSPGGSE
jgi:hypothetical protein